MMNNYRELLFKTYNCTHVTNLDQDDQAKLIWFDHYVNSNYLPHIDGFSRATSTVLDVGCNGGYLLAALEGIGFNHLVGIDLSPIDVEKAIQRLPAIRIYCTDAQSYLKEHKGEYDIIFMKAVLEHVEKNDILPLLTLLKTGLKPGGILLIDVPNMDWLFSSHERYMDFTHEVGFTKESLLQVMLNVFPIVIVEPIDSVLGLSRWGTLKKKVARYLLGKLLIWADPQGGNNSIWSRSLLGIGTSDEKGSD